MNAETILDELMAQVSLEIDRSLQEVALPVLATPHHQAVITRGLLLAEELTIM